MTGVTSLAASGTPSANNPAAVTELNRAQAAFEAADAALRKGDLATYQAKVNEAEAALAQALKLMGR